MNRGNRGCTDAIYYRPDEFGDLPVLCWCERKTVHAPAHFVREGRTLSCGNTGCEPGAEAGELEASA